MTIKTLHRNRGRSPRKTIWMVRIILEKKYRKRQMFHIYWRQTWKIKLQKGKKTKRKRSLIFKSPPTNGRVLYFVFSQQQF